MHKYEVIVNVLEREFINGKYDNSKKLPTEEELIKVFGVSRNTIRKAIEVLANKGYIYQVQGSGIFLRESFKSGCIMVNNMKGLSRDFPNKKVTTKTLEISIVDADESTAEKLNCKEGTKLYFVKRLRIIDDEPFSIETTFFNKEIIPYLNEQISAESIYQYITQDLKLNISFADKVIHCEELDRENAELLNLKEGNPALIVDNTVYLSNGLIFDVSRAVFNYKMTKLITPATYK